MNISKKALADLIENQRKTGRIFTVTFVKKDGSVRTMKYWRIPDGSGRRYNPSEYNLISAFDVIKQDYRMINPETLLSATIDGKHYEVEN